MQIRNAPAPILRVGDNIWLNSKNISTRRPLRKLYHRCLGQFKILEVISTLAYRLELPLDLKIHNVFHVSLLDLATADPNPG